MGGCGRAGSGGGGEALTVVETWTVGIVWRIGGSGVDSGVGGEVMDVLGSSALEV